MRRLRNPFLIPALILCLGLTAAGPAPAQRSDRAAAPKTDEQKLLEAMHLIQSQPLYDYVKELVSEKYGGRLTGTPEYDACADWVESRCSSAGASSRAGTTGPICRLSPIPIRSSSRAASADDEHPGSRTASSRSPTNTRTSSSPAGRRARARSRPRSSSSATASPPPSWATTTTPGVDVKGKIVLMDPEVPVSRARRLSSCSRNGGRTPSINTSSRTPSPTGPRA